MGGFANRPARVRDKMSCSVHIIRMTSTSCLDADSVSPRLSESLSTHLREGRKKTRAARRWLSSSRRNRRDYLPLSSATLAALRPTASNDSIWNSVFKFESGRGECRALDDRELRRTRMVSVTEHQNTLYLCQIRTLWKRDRDTSFKHEAQMAPVTLGDTGCKP